MRLQDLVDALIEDPAPRSAIADLLAWKRRALEMGYGVRVQAIDEYLTRLDPRRDTTRRIRPHTPRARPPVMPPANHAKMREIGDRVISTLDHLALTWGLSDNQAADDPGSGAR